MPQITIQDLSISYHGPQLLENISATVDPGERIGLLGRNGAGKTTLLRLLAGVELPDHGSIEFAAGTSIAFLPQDVPQEIVGRVWDVVASGRPAETMSDHNRWNSEQRIERTLVQMQLDGDESFKQLSAGMKRRVLLARALVSEPRILLLDEPTNHLDIDSIQWLEGFLSSLRTTLIFVTHDREFLTKLANRILEIDRGNLFDWSCDYKTFLLRKSDALAAQEKQEALFDKKLAQEEVWIRQGIKARRTRNEGRVRALEALRRQRQKRQSNIGVVKLEIDSGQRSGELVIQTKEACFGYAQSVIINRLNATIMRGDKVGIIGPNGVGKSTLLRGLLGLQPPIAGSVRHGTNLQVAYFDQTRDQLDPDKTAEENVGEGKTTIDCAGKSRHIIGYLQEFLFTPEQARSKIRFFSGGQRNRLLLAKLFSRSANLLVLDEPTNDLDTETLELLEERLVEYTGTILLVSHDRAFLNNVVTSTLVFEGKAIREYFGGYDDWLRQRSSAVQPESKSSIKRVASPNPTTKDAETGVALKNKKRSFKEQRELEELPALIHQLESEQAELHAAMAKPSFYKQSSETIIASQAKLSDLESRLEIALNRWEELES